MALTGRALREVVTVALETQFFKIEFGDLFLSRSFWFFFFFFTAQLVGFFRTLPSVMVKVLLSNMVSADEQGIENGFSL